jgi:hypothetical protein
VIVGVTDGIDCARVVKQARIDAFVVVTNLIRSAIWIHDTFQLLTLYFRISRVPWWAIAERLVIDDAAFSINSTIAWVYAKGVVAGLIQRTFIIRLASHRHWLRWWQYAQSLWVTNVSSRACALSSVENDFT